MIRTARVAAAVVIAVVAVGACASSEPERVEPLRTPRNVNEVTGIWRSPQQSTLELRKNGTFVLIGPASDAMAGDYSLSQDKFTASDTKACGGAQGTYRLQVSPQQRLVFTDPDDTCAVRRNQLTADPFVYS